MSGAIKIHQLNRSSYFEWRWSGEVETWESAAAVPRIFGLGEPDSRCDAADRSSCKCVNRNCGCCSRI